MLQNLILRTRLCGTGLITQPGWLLISTRPKRSGRNLLYHLGTMSKGTSAGLAIKYVDMMHMVGRHAHKRMRHGVLLHRFQQLSFVSQV